MLLFIICLIILLVGFVAFTGAPYVPSKRREVEKAFKKLYPLSFNDTLVDLGSGDGLVLRVASRCGARAIGFELHPILVWLSRFLSRHDDRVMIKQANLWRAKLPKQTSVVYIFADGRDMAKLHRFMISETKRLNKRLYLISYGFKFSIPEVRSVGAHFLYTFEPLQ